MPKRHATAIAHPNVALIKYWGKGDVAANIPAVPSLSITLGGLATTTTVSVADEAANPSDATPTIFLNEQQLAAEDPVAARVQHCLATVCAAAGIPVPADTTITTSNDFPTAAGLASSASGFAALVVAADAALGTELDSATVANLARRGSASAARSLLGGFVALGHGPSERDAQPEMVLAPAEWPLEVVVAVCSEQAKAVGSSNGMEQSRMTSPYYEQWLAQAPASMESAKAAIAGRDFAALATAAEASCLAMHAVMQTTQPPLLYWSAATVACMHEVQTLRRAGTPTFFSIDAGPQVKIICGPGAGDAVARTIAAIPGVSRVLRSPLGQGARPI